MYRLTKFAKLFASHEVSLCYSLLCLDWMYHHTVALCCSMMTYQVVALQKIPECGKRNVIFRWTHSKSCHHNFLLASPKP